MMVSNLYKCLCLDGEEHSLIALVIVCLSLVGPINVQPEVTSDFFNSSHVSRTDPTV